MTAALILALLILLVATDPDARGLRDLEDGAIGADRTPGDGVTHATRSA